MTKETIYGATINKQFLKFVGTVPPDVLDIGCGQGLWAKHLRNKGAHRITGIEPNPRAAVQARRQYDNVISKPVIEVSRPDFNDRSFGLIICADVLEHLIDPWTVLAHVRDWVKPQGALAISVPNIRNIRILSDLILRGKFSYSDDGGLMDRTHLRWFTRSELREALKESGWSTVYEGGSWGPKRWIFNALTAGLFENFLRHQLYTLARAA